MSDQPPPKKKVPIFNVKNYVNPSNRFANKLSFPQAQGTQSFPNGIQFGDDTAQFYTYTGYNGAGGTFTNVNITVDENGRFVDVNDDSDLSKYDFDVALNGTVITSKPSTMDYKTQTEGVLSLLNPFGATQCEIYIPSSVSVTGMTPGVFCQNMTIDGGTVTFDAAGAPNNAIVDIPNLTSIADATTTVPNPPVLNFTNSGNEITITPNGTTANVDYEETEYIAGTGNSYTVTGVVDFNYIPSIDPILSNVDYSLQSQHCLYIPIFKVAGFYDGSLFGSYYVSNYSRGEFISVNMNMNCTYTAADYPLTNAAPGVFTPQILTSCVTFSPYQLVSNWAQSVAYEGNTTRYPMSTKTYSGGNPSVPGQSVIWSNGYILQNEDSFTGLPPPPPQYPYIMPSGNTGRPMAGAWAQNTGFPGSGSFNNTFYWGGILPYNPYFTWTFEVVNKTYQGYNTNTTCKYVGGVADNFSVIEGDPIVGTGQCIKMTFNTTPVTPATAAGYGFYKTQLNYLWNVYGVNVNNGPGIAVGFQDGGFNNGGSTFPNKSVVDGLTGDLSDFIKVSQAVAN